MHAIIETGGKQYRVAPGDVIRVEKIEGEVGSEVEIPVKAAFNDAGELVQVAPVKATITGNGRGEKIIVFKFKRKKQYKKTIGHRQSYTELTVDEVGGVRAEGHEASAAQPEAPVHEPIHEHPVSAHEEAAPQDEPAAEEVHHEHTEGHNE